MTETDEHNPDAETDSKATEDPLNADGGDNGEAPINSPEPESNNKRAVASSDEKSERIPKKVKTREGESKSAELIHGSSQQPPLPPRDGQQSEEKVPPADGEAQTGGSADTKDAPSTPKNQSIGGTREGTSQRQQLAGATVGMPPHQLQHPHMGYPPQMMGGMMHGQYPPGMMQGYAPYHPHGYPGQAPQPMMMGQQQHMTGHPSSAHPPGMQANSNPAGGQHMPQHPQSFGYFGQPPPGANDSSQQSMGTPPGPQGANRHPQHPSGPFQQMPGMMHMQMPTHMMHYGPPGMFFPPYHMQGAAMMNPVMAQAFNGNSQTSTASARGGNPSQQQQSYMPAPPPRSAGTPLSLSCDDEQLSEYQMLVRKQLEIFEAQPEDVESNTQGRKKQVVLGQVGLRCRHCAGYPLRQRGRGAVYYPAKLQGVYQAAQNMASSHLCESCQSIPPQLKQDLRTLRDRRDTASGGKQYWADGARAMGLVETEDGLRLRRTDGAPPA